jgi:hypothetical protein
MRNPEVFQVNNLLGEVNARATRKKRLNLGNKNTKGGILLAVYYAGHGFHMNGTTHCLYNEKTKKHQNPHPLERQLRTLV